MKKLIPLSAYVIEQTSKDYLELDKVELSDKKIEIYLKALMMIDKYARFLRTPLELGQFVPCKDGKELNESMIYSKEDDVIFDSESFDIYKEAKSRVMLEGWEFLLRDGDWFRVYNGKICLDSADKDGNTFTIEDVLGFDLTPTPACMNQLGLNELI